VSGRLMRRSKTLGACVALVVAVLAGCGQSQSVPSGAQLVHLVATASEVHLSPATVHAGDVYLELDDPADGGSFVFVVGAATAAATPGPLTDTALEQLAHGDTQGTGQSSEGPSCSGPQGADRGHLAQPGVCGDVFKFVLVPGKYAILGPGWTQQMSEPSINPTVPPSGPVLPPTMAVLP
jgi:hypothetical protein